MKKMTWNEVKERGKEVYQKNKEVFLVTGGFVGGIILDTILEIYFDKKHAPEQVKFVWYTNKKYFGVKCWNIDKYGKKTYATGFGLDPAEAIRMAREILFDLAGEAK